jgi:hypothetical protein
MRSGVQYPRAPAEIAFAGRRACDHPEDIPVEGHRRRQIGDSKVDVIQTRDRHFFALVDGIAIADQNAS